MIWSFHIVWSRLVSKRDQTHFSHYFSNANNDAKLICRGDLVPFWPPPFLSTPLVFRLDSGHDIRLFYNFLKTSVCPVIQSALAIRGKTTFTTFPTPECHRLVTTVDVATNNPVSFYKRRVTSLSLNPCITTAAAAATASADIRSVGRLQYRRMTWIANYVCYGFSQLGALSFVSRLFRKQPLQSQTNDITAAVIIDEFYEVIGNSQHSELDD